MFLALGWTLLLLLLLYAINTCWNLVRNIQVARACGIPYVVVPFYSYNFVAVILSRPLRRIADKWFPAHSPVSWRHLLILNWSWKLRYAPFASLGSDTFLIVAPGGIIMNTADAAVISQIMTRSTDFPKAIHLYKNVDIYGKNVVSSEGAVWRHHRRLTAPAFSERNNYLVWKETLEQSRAMVASWIGPNGKGRTVHDVASETIRLSLNIMSRAALGQKVEWTKSTDNDEVGKETLPDGHKMTVLSSLICLLNRVILIMILPKWLLKRSPVARHRESYEAYDEFRTYMKEMIAAKKTAIESGANESATIDLIGQLAKGSNGGMEGKSQSMAALTDSEVIGNLFVFMIAGHETSASSIHFSLLLLAIHPEVQKEAQEDLERTFNGRPISQWQYDRDVPRLLESMLGAVLNEELRYIAPIWSIPKVVSAIPQQLMVDSRKVTLPANMMVRLCVPGVHRNPKFWPHGPPKDLQNPHWSPSNLDNDLEEFKPDRWVTKKEATYEVVEKPSQETETTEHEDSPNLYTPIKGSYIPFSDGQRACLGRRFAQVEILAALAVILTEFSVELAVDEWATDEEIERMTKEERTKVWRKAKEKANWKLQNKTSMIITLQLRGAHVPVRLVQKGEERFRVV